MKSPTKQPEDPAPRREFNTFKMLAAKLVRVPKSEVDSEEAAYQRLQAKKPRRGPKKK